MTNARSRATLLSDLETAVTFLDRLPVGTPFRVEFDEQHEEYGIDIEIAPTGYLQRRAILDMLGYYRMDMKTDVTFNIGALNIEILGLEEEQ